MSSIFTKKRTRQARLNSTLRRHGSKVKRGWLLDLQLVRQCVPDLLAKSLSLTPGELKACGKIEVELSRIFKISGKGLSETGGPCEDVPVNIDAQFPLPTSENPDEIIGWWWMQRGIRL